MMVLVGVLAEESNPELGMSTQSLTAKKTANSAHAGGQGRTILEFVRCGIQRQRNSVDVGGWRTHGLQNRLRAAVEGTK
jgi:hypothetical protein